MKKIGSKLLIINLLFVCSAIFLALFISYQTVNSILLEYASSLGTACAEVEAEEIDSWLNAKITLLESIAVQIEDSQSNDEEGMEKILKNAAKADPSFYSFFIGFESGKLMDANGWIPPSDYNTVERPWYREAVGANCTIFTSAYIDKKKNSRVKAIATPLSVQNTNAVLAANIPFDTIRKQIQSIHFGQTGYGILTDGDGIVLIHPDKNNEMKPLEEVRRSLGVQVQENNWKSLEGAIVIRDGNKLELLVHVPIQSNDWKLLLLAPLEEFQGPAKKMARKLIASFTLLMGLMVVISYLLGKRLSRPTGRVVKENKIIAAGNYDGAIEDFANGSEAACCNGTVTRKELHIAGTEEVYDIADQIDEIAIQLEKGVRSFKINE